ncbi:MAG: glycosyltransferase family 4 protein [Gemmatimonadota bacterium]|nr:glycosyltransferase family 4 protein [Gemmatimonadota bacterium]
MIDRAKRLLICTQWFDPEPTPKGFSFAAALHQRGFEVDVLTGFPNYPEGRVYPGYRLRPYERESFGGVNVHRVWLYPSHDRSAVRRGINYLSFAASVVVAGLTKVPRPNLVYAYHPPPTVGWAGALLASRFRAPLVIDVQDLWPETVASSGMMRSGFAMRALEVGCLWEYRRADRVVALSSGMADLLEARGVPRKRLRVIRNWADERRLSSSWETAVRERARTTIGNGFSVLFAGQMGQAQSLGNALESAALTPEIRWVFMGGGTDRARLERMAGERALANVSFVDRVPLSEVGAWLEAAGALLVHLSDDPLYAASIPSKTQAYLLAGRPVLMAAAGDAAALVADANAGVTCAPGRPERLAAAARRLAEMTPVERDRLGANGHAYYKRELAFSVGVDAFAQLFHETIAH